MSGSPIMVQHGESEIYVMGIHHGRIPESNEKVGGCLLNESTTHQIEAWMF